MAPPPSPPSITDLRDPNYFPPLARAFPLGIQHVLAMFVANITPAFIEAFQSQRIGPAHMFFMHGFKSALFRTLAQGFYIFTRR